MQVNQVTHTYIARLSHTSATAPLGWGWCLPWVKARPDTQHKAGRAAEQVLLPPRRSPSALAPAPSSSSWWTSAHPTLLLSVFDVVSASPSHHPPGTNKKIQTPICPIKMTNKNVL